MSSRESRRVTCPFCGRPVILRQTRGPGEGLMPRHNVSPYFTTAEGPTVCHGTGIGVQLAEQIKARRAK